MKDFFKMLGASTLGMIIGGMILFFFSFFVVVSVATSFASEPAYTVKDKTVLKIDLSGAISDRVDSNPFSTLLMGSTAKGTSLNSILVAIEKAKENDKVKGIYVKMGGAGIGFANIEPLRKALEDFKESGKFVISYGETISQGSYYVASVSDKIFMNPQGMLDLGGLAWSTQFNRDVFRKMGIEIQVFKVGTYKSAVEPYTEVKMSDANREQVTSYMTDIWGHILEGISAGRNIPVEDLNKYADERLTFADPQKMVEYKLIDELKYGSEVDAYIKDKLGLGEDDKIEFASVDNVKTLPDKKVKKSKDRIAVLYAEGNIDSDEMGSLLGGINITAKEYVKELQKLKDDDNVKAVVFRVNSPGGSAYASEQIWHAVEELKAVKPIIVSMGDYAASGGYYISCGATKIVAEHNTLTGSIGIFGMFPSGQQLAEKMGAHHDGVGTNQHSLFGGDVISIPFLGFGMLPARPLNDTEMAMLQTYVERGYDTFLTRCADGRGMTKAQIDSIGQGRVWTGNQALELGLIDELGSMSRAIEIAAEEAGISEYSMAYYPAPKDFFTQLMEESASGLSTRIVQSIVGKESYEQQAMLKAWQSFDYRQAVISSVISNQ